MGGASRRPSPAKRPPAGQTRRAAHRSRARWRSRPPILSLYLSKPERPSHEAPSVTKSLPHAGEVMPEACCQHHDARRASRLRTWAAHSEVRTPDTAPRPDSKREAAHGSRARWRSRPLIVLVYPRNPERPRHDAPSFTKSPPHGSAAAMRGGPAALDSAQGAAHSKVRTPGTEPPPEPKRKAAQPSRARWRSKPPIRALYPGNPGRPRHDAPSLTKSPPHGSAAAMRGGPAALDPARGFAL